MYAYEIPGLRFSGVAKTDVKRYTFVSPDTDGQYINSAVGKTTVGVSMNDPKAGEVLEIADGIVKVMVGEAITAGSQVKVGAAGVAMTSADGVGAVGIALTTAKVNEQVTVKLG